MGIFSDPFGAKAVEKGQQRAAKIAKRGKAEAVGYIKSDPREASLNKYAAGLGNQGITPVNTSGPSYNIGLSKDGVNIGRTGEAQGWMDTLGRGTNTDEAGFNNLLTQLNPGYGRLSQAAIARLEQAKRKATGDMRAQFARRNLTEGSSFVADTVRGVGAEYDLLQQQAEAEAMVEEMKQTESVLTARGDARIKNITTALNQVQFEGNMAATLSAEVMGAQQEITAMQVDLTKYAASIGNQGDIAKANVSAGLSNTNLGMQSAFSSQAAQAAGGPMQVATTLAGAAIGAGTGGGAGAGLHAAKSSVSPA